MSKIHLPSNSLTVSVPIIKEPGQRNGVKVIESQKRLVQNSWTFKLHTSTSHVISTNIIPIRTEHFSSFTKSNSPLRGYNLFSNYTVSKRNYATEKQKIDPETKETIETLFKIGLKHLQMKNYAEAVPVFNDLVGMIKGPMKVPALVYKGMSLFELGILDIAEQTIDEALALAKRHAVARVYKGACLVGQSKFEQAYNVLKSVEDDWEKIKDQLDFRAQTVFHLNCALSCFENGHPDDALDHFDKLDNLDKRAIFEIFASSFIRGSIYMEMGQLDKAVECFDKEIAEIPKLASDKISTSDIVAVTRECFINRAIALTEMKKHEEALDSWEHILKLYTAEIPVEMTTRITALEAKANILLEMQKPVEALHAAEEAKRLIKRTEELIAQADKSNSKEKQEAQDELKEKAAKQTKVIEDSMMRVKDKTKQTPQQTGPAEAAKREQEIQKILKDIENNKEMFGAVAQLHLRGTVPQIYNWIQKRGKSIRMNMLLLLLAVMLGMYLYDHSTSAPPRAPEDSEQTPPEVTEAPVVESDTPQQKAQ